MTTRTESRFDVRWLRLAAAALSMMLIGLYQYSWAIFKSPLQDAVHVDSSTVQLTFTLSTWAMTLSQPFSGYVADRHGPLLVNLLGAAIAGMGWILSSFAGTPTALYLAYGLGSVGVGAIYGVAVGTATRWFPDRRGLATGLVAFGFGFGAAVFNGPIVWIGETLGYRLALLYVGVLMLIALITLGLIANFSLGEQQFTRSTTGVRGAARASFAGAQYGPREMLRTRQWWMLYVAFIMTANTGLMVTAQLADMGAFFGAPGELVVLASEVFAVTNGVGRIVGGWVSDRLGRERTMSLFFTLQGILSLLLMHLGSHGTVFVALTAAIGFLWGPIFTFFPAIIADYYGRRDSTVNYGITYTAKGWGGLLGGYVSAVLSSVYGGFTTPILASALLSFGAAILSMPPVLNKPRTRA